MTIKENRIRYRAEMRTDPRDPRHGTMAGISYGCPCEACKRARSEYDRRRYLRKKAGA